MIKNEKGVTMLVLVVTIVILLVLAAVSINFAIKDSDYAIEKKQLVEMEMVATAVHEQYIKYQKTGNGLVGTPDQQLTEDIEKDMNGKDVSTVNKEGWYKLTKDDLKKIGINDSAYEYLVK